MREIAMTVRTANDSDRTAWDALVSHPLQSWAWGDFRMLMGIDVVRLAVTKAGKFVNGWQLTFHSIPYTPWTIGYFPKGPKPSQGMLKELISLGKQKHAIFIQLEPNVMVTKPSSLNSKPFLHPSHHPLFTKDTFVLDLTKSEQELLGAMHHKTRYNIRLAQRHGVVVKEDSSPKALEAYLKLTQETTGRQGFYAHNQTYHRRMWETLRQSSGQAAPIAHLFTASYKGNIVSAWVVFVWKETVYYPYGASSRNYREVMAPTLMLWEIARWAKKKGLTSFDLWGALGPNADEADPWYGFHRFKQGFNPKTIEFIGSYDLVINKPFYELYKIADRLRWFLLTK